MLGGTSHAFGRLRTGAPSPQGEGFQGGAEGRGGGGLGVEFLSVVGAGAADGQRLHGAALLQDGLAEYKQ